MLGDDVETVWSFNGDCPIAFAWPRHARAFTSVFHGASPPCPGSQTTISIDAARNRSARPRRRTNAPNVSSDATSAESRMRRRQRPLMRSSLLLISLCFLGSGCSKPSPVSVGDANSGIDSLNARLVRAYQNRDPRAYAALYTDTAVFEWPAFNTVRGPAALADMARGNWAAERDVDLRLDVASRRIAADHATEFGAFQQSWKDSNAVRMTEFGRYVTHLLRQPDGSWRIDRFFGFEDSTRTITGGSR